MDDSSSLLADREPSRGETGEDVPAGTVSEGEASSPAEPEQSPLRELLTIAWPLMLSSGSLTLMTFCDRVFLAWYSQAAIAAALPAALLHYSVSGLALGICQYVNTFVAQNEGAGRKRAASSSVWQGAYLSLLVGIPLMACVFVSEPLLAWSGQPEHLQALEKTYFDILVLGSVPFLLSVVLSCFFSGRGETRVVMWVDIGGVIVNLVLDYVFIFGWAFIPEGGIAGAAYATVLSRCLTCAAYLAWLALSPASKEYGFFEQWRPNAERMWRLLRYGFPQGFHMLADVVGITVFLFLLGQLGEESLAATNMAFNVNALVFIPMIGMGTAVATVVGQRVAEGRPDRAAAATWMAARITGAGCLVYALVCLTAADVLLLPYGLDADPEEFAKTSAIAERLMLFIAAYTLFDMLAILFGSAIRGAGDVVFPLLYGLTCCWLIMVTPTALMVHNGTLTLNRGWLWLTGYIAVLGTGFVLRFLGGKWRTMTVLEPDVTG